MEQVILVNEHDEETGTMEKMTAHEKGVLHRAFSVFLFDNNGAMLLQQRALHKYHSGGLWTNACCSHPRPGEATETAAVRRLHEEMGFTTTLQKAFHFTYHTAFDNGLTEHEFDHVFTGRYNGDIQPNEQEVKDYAYQPMKKIEERLQTDPEQFTAWFRIAFPRVKEWMEQYEL